MSIRKFVVAAFFLALLLACPPFGSAQTKALKKIRVGVPSVSMGNIIIFVTKEARLYEKHGLDAEIITMNGSGIASKALISGNIQIAPIATPTVINADLAGGDADRLMALSSGIVDGAAMSHPGYGRARKLGFSMQEFLW